MTVSTTGDNDFGDIGLEDIGVADIVIPRIQIMHREGRFKNNLTNEEFETMDAIMLGLVKQRIMWPDDLDDGDKPLCKSPDNGHGFPNVRDDIPKAKQFPWAESNFAPENFPASKGINQLVTLPCDSCIFAKWDAGDWKAPPCNEQYTFPILYSTDGGESYFPALFTTAKTGIKPSRQYISGFAQSKQPMFTVHTTIGLNLQKKGANPYSVPTYAKGPKTDPDRWNEYGQQLRTIREFVRTPPTNREMNGEDEQAEAEAKPENNTNTGPSTPPASSTPPPAETAPTKAETPPAPADDDDDLPF